MKRGIIVLLSLSVMLGLGYFVAVAQPRRL
jgi:hypothetical protein